MVSMGRALDRQSAALRRPDLKLFIKDVRDRQQRKRAITIRSWSTIQEVKLVIQKIMHVPPNAQRLYFGPLLSSGGELPNHRTLHDAGIYRSGETLLLDIKVGNSVSPTSNLTSAEGNDICISSSMIDSTPKVLRSVVQKARRGFQVGLKPSLFLDGSGGSYAMFDPRKKKVAVFKASDEEPYAENNPRGYIRQAGQPMALREGIEPGEACMREVAAFLLDHDGFSGVPMTTLVEARHPAFNYNGSRLKVAQGGASIGSHSINAGSASAHSNKKKVGSFQEFVNAECTMDDISPSKISVEEVHKVAILDIRIMNADRNSANLLVRRRRDNTLELVPIDHGFCLRSVGDVSWMDWCWLDWPQLKEPLSEKSRRYIQNLDIEEDARMLTEHLNINSDAVLDLFRSSCRILKAGVQAGFSLYDIACMCCRNDDLGELPSKLEILYSMAEDLSLSALENEKWHHSAASRALAEQLSPHGDPLISDQWRPSESSRNTNRMHKSASSVQFHAIYDLDAASTEEESKKPGITQSSASDSSLEAGDILNEKEECDEWAANLLTNISMERSMSIQPTRVNDNASACSEDDSEEDLSGSPKGFWHIRPGSPSLQSDDDSSSWNVSPETSPIHGVELTRPSSAQHLRLPEAPFMGNASKREASVHFVDDAWINRELEVPSCLSSPDGDEKKSGDPLPKPSLPKAGGKMQRSQSYSAISAMDAPSTSGPPMSFQRKNGSRYPDPCTKEYEHFRDYFLKFVDLVIVRETRALTARLQSA